MFQSALRLPAVVAFAVAAILVASCTQSTTLMTVVVPLSITGSSTVAPLVSDFAKRYETEHTYSVSNLPNGARIDVRIDVQTGGSSRGIADVRNGLANLGMVSRALKADESDLQAVTIALDGVCIIVHADNQVDSLSDDEVAAIYTGKLQNWSEVGGADAPITVVNKAEGRSTLEVFANYYKLDTKTIEADIVIGDNEQGIKTVVGNKDAIGYVSIGTAEYHRLHGVRIKLLPVGGIAATPENVANGTFPMSRPLNLVTLGPPSYDAAKFIEFARSEENLDILKDHGFVPPQPQP
jgi:phosphate transport system substrate-binding protein